ncbi:hypothetical protein [Streptomyces sp. G-G2]|uniref:hypothetical protein n=1 Tax=Streptomyces sp. G-G2 TaxID=3046201 RepID=UPI0024BB8E82|nr:hypothetical protein [Streptomyces sp. G-G2]MDJ0382160.1 hypothetical protein [Streptomyces sp. G-G2]
MTEGDAVHPRARRSAPAILTIAGAVLYTMPAERPELYAAAALVLAAAAAWCLPPGLITT